MKQIINGLLIVIIAGLCSEVSANILNFQEGVAPSASYTAGAVTIRSDVPDGNQNGSDELLAGVYLGGGVFHGLLEFDLSDIAGALAIHSASLVMTTSGSSGAGNDDGNNIIRIQVYSYTNNLDETTSTWNNPSTGDGTAGGTLGVFLADATFNNTTQGLDVEFTNSPAFRTAVSNALDNDGVLRLLLKRDGEPDTTDFVRFVAESAGGELGRRPELIVNYDPSPEQHFQEGVAPSASYTVGAVTIRSDVPDGNQNGSDELLAGVYLGGGVFHGLLEFDLSDIAGALAIHSASLVMTTSGSSGAGNDDGNNIIRIQVYSYTNNLDETTSTWNNPSTGDGTAGGTLGVFLADATFNNTTQGLDVEFTNSPAFRTAVSNALDNDGVLRLLLKRDGEPDTTDFVRFVAESAGGELGRRPELIVRYTPAPKGTLIIIK